MSADKDDSAPSCVFFKAPARRVNVATSSKRRQQSSSNSSSSSGDESQPAASTFRSLKTVKKGLVTTSTNHSLNKRRQHTAGSDDEDRNDKEKLIDTKFKSDRQAQPQGPRDMGATATIEIDTDTQQDQQTIFERAKKINEELKGKVDDKIYRGMNNYQQFYEKKDTAQGNASSGLVRNKGEIII
jgi:RING finger protein 113A